MNISIIGSGNTATVLGKLLKQNNHTINEVVGRNKDAVQELAETLNANACFDLNVLNKNSEIYLIAVSDNAVEEISKQIHLKDKIVAHTCGSVSINVLANSSNNYGIFYPLQSLRKELNYAPAIPFLIDGNNDSTKQILFNLAQSISTNISYATDDVRLKYHLTAIIVSNFTNHLFALAKDYCDNNKIDFKLLLPLIQETSNRLEMYEPSKMQTGPAARGDYSTIEKHLQLLNHHPQLKALYEMMTESIIKFKQ